MSGCCFNHPNDMDDTDKLSFRPFVRNTLWTATKTRSGIYLKKESRAGHKHKIRHHLFWVVLCVAAESSCCTAATPDLSPPNAPLHASTAWDTLARLHTGSASMRTWLGGGFLPFWCYFLAFCISRYIADSCFFCSVILSVQRFPRLRRDTRLQTIFCLQCTEETWRKPFSFNTIAPGLHLMYFCSPHSLVEGDRKSVV